MIVAAQSARQWFRSYFASQIKPGSAEQKEIQLNHFARYLGREPLLTDFSVEQIEASTSQLITTRHWSLGTAAKYKREIRAIWSRAAATGHAGPAGKLGKVKPPKNDATAWTEHQVDIIVNATQLLDGNVDGIPLSAWTEAKLRWLHNSGARHNETLELRRSDFDLDNGVARIPGRFRKNGQPLAVTLTAGTVAALRRIWRPCLQDAMFPWPHQVRALDGLLRRLLILAVLRGTQAVRDLIAANRRQRGVHLERLVQQAVDKRDLWHKWRRTFATHAYARSRDIELVKRWLDHSDLKVTYGYIDWTQVGGVTQRDVIRDPGGRTQLQLFDTGT
jgi:integrase